jgi:hypothetical protein
MLVFVLIRHGFTTSMRGMTQLLSWSGRYIIWVKRLPSKVKTVGHDFGAFARSAHSVFSSSLELVSPLFEIAQEEGKCVYP